MTTTPRTHLKTWTRRVLGATLTLILTAAALAGVILAGVVVSSRSIHQPVPTDSADVPATSLTHTEAGGPQNPTLTRKASRSWSRSSRAPTAPSPATSSRPTTSSRARRRSPPTSSQTPPTVPLEGGPAVVPTHTFDDIDADPTLRPDLVVVPGLTQPTGQQKRRCAIGWPASTQVGQGSSACAAARWCSPPPGCSTGWTPPATGHASAP